MTNLIIEIPVTIDCVGILIDSGEPGHLGDFREATVDEQAIRVRMAGLTSLERELLEALKFMTAYSALNADGCIGDEGKLVDVMLNPDDHGNVGRTIDMARATIAKAGGAK